MAIMFGSGFISSGLCGLPKLGGDDAVSIRFGSITQLAQLTSTFTYVSHFTSLHFTPGSDEFARCSLMLSKYSRNRIQSCKEEKDFSWTKVCT